MPWIKPDLGPRKGGKTKASTQGQGLEGANSEEATSQRTPNRHKQPPEVERTRLWVVGMGNMVGWGAVG